MSFFSILETVFIGPLKLIFEIIFQYALKFVKNPGYAIIFLSLAMNFLVLPLYRRADAVQEEARDVENKLKKGTAHIKKTFTGNERMMMLQTYNKQNNYKPTDVFKGSVSLLLEIPFFMAAYQFLSHLSTLNGVKFGPITDLSKPDGLLVIFGITLNLLPILMTLINVISSALYLKGFPLKTKIQLYGMALFFLVFLYTSPSGLVFYWTLNNVFSLVKNIFYKIKNPQFVLKILSVIVGIASIIYGITYEPARVPLTWIGIILLLPSANTLFQKLFKTKPLEIKAKPSKGSFLMGAMFLIALIGLYIPSNFIAASPQEYVDVTYFHHPMLYIFNSIFMAVGFFGVWFGVFYWLANDKWKVIFERLIWLMSGGAIVNYMFFGTKLGVISPELKYDNGLIFAEGEKLANIAVLIAISLIMLLIIIKWRRFTAMVLLTATLAITAISGMNVITIRRSVNDIKTYDSSTMPHFNLSKNGKNVVIIMLDRAMGLYVPYILNEKPELVEKFDGFTYYSNTISFGMHTNIAVPAMIGGYEYTPIELNKRTAERLGTKHDEALKVLPVLFSQNGYRVSICDPPYAGYSWIPDLSIYNGYSNIHPFVSEGLFGDESLKVQAIENNTRNFFCFSLMKSVPVAFQDFLYNDASYNQAAAPEYITPQKIESLTTATGINPKFMKSYNVLNSLHTMTYITEDGENNFLFLANNSTHEPAMLSLPEYAPSVNVDNTEYEKQNADRFTVNGETLTVDTKTTMITYHANMASFIQLAEWFDFLRENDIYDNTKIILVSDHAYSYNQTDKYTYDGVDMSGYFPLLMVKDFDSKGFTVSEEFMTNADVPTLATDGTIDNPVNPFTGNPINSDAKTAHPQFISLTHRYTTTENCGEQFKEDPWMVIDGSLLDTSKWTHLSERLILTEHKIPEK